jgi:hypothetical protein
MTKSRLVLLDANIVIHLFELEVWDQIIKRFDVVLAQTVVDESDHYRDDEFAIEIDLQPYIDSGRVTVRELKPSQVEAYCNRFDASYIEKLDPGEAESLCLLEDDPGSLICSADKIVWRVLGNLGMGERGISLEEMLGRAGLTRSLRRQFTKVCREEWTKRGFGEGLMGQGAQ